MDSLRISEKLKRVRFFTFMQPVYTVSLINIRQYAQKNYE